MTVSLLKMYLPEENISAQVKALREYGSYSVQGALAQAKSQYKSSRKAGIKLAIEGLPDYQPQDQDRLTLEILNEMVDML